jgi:hypothetical protein
MRLVLSAAKELSALTTYRLVKFRWNLVTCTEEWARLKRLSRGLKRLTSSTKATSALMLSRLLKQRGSYLS